MGTTLQDLRFAVRTLLRQPGFTAVALLSLALGIGANTAIFSLLHTVVLRTLPVAQPEQLVEFLQKYPGEPRGSGYWGWASYEHFRDNNRTFAALTGVSFDNLAPVRGEGIAPETVIRENVLGNYFRVLGLKPALGRLIAQDDVPAGGAGNVAVVSWSFWNRSLHRDAAVVGKRILVNNQPMTVIGVAPRAYTGPRVGVETDIWAPQEKESITILGRLKPRATIEQARAEMAVLYRFTIEQRAARSKDSLVRQMKMELEPAGAGLSRVRDQYGKPLALLMTVVGLLLLLACINMASMLLARSAGRQRELGIRMAMGAGRSRLVRQMLTESVLLSGAGTILGIVLAYFGTGLLVTIMASGRAHERIDIRVTPDLDLLLFTAAIGLFTGLLFGVAPAYYAFRSAPAASMRSGHAGDPWFWRWFGKSLVASQVALSILLVAATAVFLGHVRHLRNLDLGFRSDNVLLVVLDPAGSGYRREQLVAPYQELLARLEKIPGVRSASVSGCTPLQGCGASRFVNAEGFQERPEDRRFTSLSWVAPKYFETLGVPLIAGRDFAFADAGRPRVAIINQSMARHYFPNASPLGRHIAIDPDPRTGGWYGDNQPYEVVGVVGDTKITELREPPSRTMYFNMFQDNRLFYQFELRTGGDPAAVSGAVRRTVRDVLTTITVSRITTLYEQVDATIVPERLIATLSEFFGALGAVLAGIGLYGLLAYTVTRRTNEIGVRMALGATQANVSRLVLREAVGMVVVGLLLGAALVRWSSPLAASLIADLKPQIALPLGLASLVIFAVALLAAYVPARRAARVDPMVALRQQ